MKRLVLSFTAIVSLLTIAAAPVAFASAAAIQISQPGTYNSYTGKYYENTTTFGVQYTLLATGSADFSVQLYQNGVAAGTAQSSHTDTQSAVGNSGTFTVSVADNTYSYYVVATCTSGDCPAGPQTSKTVAVTVDTKAPAAPNYLGKSASGGSTVIKFTAPSDSDVTTVGIYAGSTKTYTADSSHAVATPMHVTPRQPYTVTVSAPSTMYFAVEAFDAAGNGSSLTGDPGTVVHPVVAVASGGQGGGVTTAAASGNPATSSGQVQGTDTGTSQGGTTVTGNNGNISAGGSSSTSKNKSNNKGKVLGAATTSHSARNTVLTIIGIVVVGGALLYYLFFTRRDKSLLPRK